MSDCLRFFAGAARNLEGKSAGEYVEGYTSMIRREPLGIVAGICRVLAERGVNIAELTSQSRPGPGGSPHYQMGLRVEVPDSVEVRALREALEAEADRLVIDVAVMPA